MAGQASFIDVAKDAHRSCVAAKVGYSNLNPPSPARFGFVSAIRRRRRYPNGSPQFAPEAVIDERELAHRRRMLDYLHRTLAIAS